MPENAFDFADLYRSDIRPAAASWAGFPKHNFIGGHNAPESIDVEALAEASSNVLRREGPSLAMYKLHSGPLGYLPLREFLSEKLDRQAGITCTPDEILLTSGSLQAIDLVNEALLAPGDTIITEQATYGGCLTRFTRAGVRAIAVPVDDEGLRTDILEEELQRLGNEGIRPKYIYTIPTVQNPTGTIMPLARRKRLLELAEAHNVAIFEDECYSDLIWDGKRPPALYALDTSGRVVFCSTFSKSIAPALRVGYLVAKWPFLSRVLAGKTDAGSGALEQMMLGEYCPQHFDGHVSKLNELLERKLDVLIASLTEQFGTAAEFKRPPGGIFLWVRLPDSVDTTKLAQVAASEGIAVNPGDEWTKDQPDGNRHIRICFASSTEAQIREGIAALADVCYRTFGTPERSGNVAR